MDIKASTLTTGWLADTMKLFLYMIFFWSSYFIFNSLTIISIDGDGNVT